MVFLTCSVSFRSISCRYFSKWPLEIFLGGKKNPVPSDFAGLHYPVLGCSPGFFFIKMTAKDVKEICPGSLCFAFWCNRRQTVRVVVTIPLRKRRVKIMKVNFEFRVTVHNGQKASSTLTMASSIQFTVTP